jgi:hypothetical protein
LPISSRVIDGTAYDLRSLFGDSPAVDEVEHETGKAPFGVRLEDRSESDDYGNALMTSSEAPRSITSSCAFRNAAPARMTVPNSR